MSEYVVFDLETTGFSHHRDRVIEIATVRLDEDFDVIERWETLVNPNRDVGPTHKHGITAADVGGAPRFEELLGDVWHRFEGAVPVSHNLGFDWSFLASEYDRAGFSVGRCRGVCTLALMRRMATGHGNRLADCCDFFGIPLTNAHAAANDAEACAQLLKSINTEFGLPSQTCPSSHSDLWRMPATTAGLARPESRARQATSASPLSSVIAAREDVSVPEGVAENAADEYLGLLDLAVEDQVIDEVELEALRDLASRLGLRAENLRELHSNYLASIAASICDDDQVTAAERREFDRLAGLLEIPTEEAEALLKNEAEHRRLDHREDFRGMTVCFTGTSQCSVDGQPLDQVTAAELAVRHGLVPAKGVTKKLNLLVVTDPDSMSGKAKKARRYGTRIIAERAFWRKLGVAVG